MFRARTALKAGGADLAGVVKRNVYVVGGQPFQPAFEAFQKAFGPAAQPAGYHRRLRLGARTPGVFGGDGSRRRGGGVAGKRAYHGIIL